MMHFFQHNLMAKILSLCGAVLLWVYVMNEQNPVLEASYTVVVTKNVEATNLLVENVPDTVRVTFKGPRNTILTLRQQDIKANIDLSGLKVGEQEVPIDVVVPRGLTLVTQQPLSATIIADSYEAKSVPVVVRRLGTMPDVHGVIDTTVEPESVIVSGAKRNVDKVVQALATVKLDNKKNSFSDTVDVVALDASDKLVKDVMVTPQTANVQVKVNFVDIIKNVSVSPVIEGKPADGYVIGKVDITPAEVQVGGRTADINPVQLLVTEPIDVTGAKADVIKNVRLVGVDKIYGTNREVTVAIRIVKSSSGENNAKDR